MQLEPEIVLPLATAGISLLGAAGTLGVLFYRVSILERLVRDLDESNKALFTELHQMKEGQIAQGRDVEWIRSKLAK